MWIALKIKNDYSNQQTTRTKGNGQKRLADVATDTVNVGHGRQQ